MKTHAHHHESGASSASCVHCPPGAKVRWYTQPKQWVLRVVIPVLLAGVVWPPLQPLGRAFWHYVHLTWWAIGLGFLIGGLIERFVPKTYVAKLLARPSPRTILVSTGLGVLASGCSHGCLALSMQLYKI